MAEHPNVERTRRGFRAFAEGDIATFRELLRDDVVWRIPGRSRLAGEYRGLEAALGALRLSMELTAGTYRVDLRYVLADDDHVVAVYRATGQRDGRSLDIGQALVCRLEEGRWVELDAVPFDQYAFDEFWA